MEEVTRIRPAVTIRVAAATPTTAQITSTTQKSCGGVKLEPYDGTSCLETFLASVKNFATYFNWTDRDELFHLKASLRGPAGQVLWDLGPDVKLAEMTHLLKQRFGSTDQVERFRMELRARRRRVGEDLQSLYNDIRRLMSLAYPGPNTTFMDVVGHESFLEALGDPELRVRILDKMPTTMDEALNLEPLEKSKETYLKALEPPVESSDEELRGMSRLAVKSVDAADGQPESEQRTAVLVDVTQLKEVLTSCIQEATNKVLELRCNEIRMSSGDVQRSMHQKDSNAPNSPDLNPVDYKMWGVMQDRVYQKKVKDVNELRE